MIVVGLSFLVTLLVTFENVDGLERLHALALIIGISAAMPFLGMFVF